MLSVGGAVSSSATHGAGALENVDGAGLTLVLPVSRSIRMGAIRTLRHLSVPVTQKRHRVAETVAIAGNGEIAHLKRA